MAIIHTRLRGFKPDINQFGFAGCNGSGIVGMEWQPVIIQPGDHQVVGSRISDVYIDGFCFIFVNLEIIQLWRLNAEGRAIRNILNHIRILGR